MELEIGKTYKFTHSRKGVFIATLTAIVPGDGTDPEFWECTIDTRRGTGQERLARSNANTTVTNIRPSLITCPPEEVKDGKLQVHIPAPAQTQEQYLKQILRSAIEETEQEKLKKQKKKGNPATAFLSRFQKKQ